MSGASSVFSLTTFRRPASSTASRSTAGETIRHGPHHGAQKSMRTGIEARISSSNVADVASTAHGSALWQFPHRGMPSTPRAMRFLRPQCGQLTTTVAAGMARGSAPGAGAAVARLAGVALADLDLAWLGLLGLGHADLEHAVVQARLGLDVAAEAGQRHRVLELADASGATAQDALALALHDRAADRQLAFVGLDVHVLGARTGQLGLQDPGVVGLLDVDVGHPRADDLGRRAHHLLQKLGGLLLDLLQLTERLVALRGLHALPVPPAVVASYEHGHGVLLLASLPVAPAPRPRRARAKPTRDEVLSRASGASPTAYLMR